MPSYPITQRGVAFIRYLWRTACIWLAAACRSTTQPEYPNQISISKVVSSHLHAPPAPLWSVSIISCWKCPIRNPLRHQEWNTKETRKLVAINQVIWQFAPWAYNIHILCVNSRLYSVVNKARTNYVLCPAIGYEMGPPSAEVRSDPLNNVPDPKEKSLRSRNLSLLLLKKSLQIIDDKYLVYKLF